MNNLLLNVEKSGNIKLSFDEKQYLIDQINKIDFNRFKNYDKDSLFNALVGLMYNGIMKRRKNLNIKSTIQPTVQPSNTNNTSNTSNTNKPVKYNVLNQEYDMHLYLSNQIKDASMDEKNTANIQTSPDAIRPRTTELEIASLFGLNNAFGIQQLFNPEATYIRNYIVLDSRYRIINETNSNNIIAFTWSYVDNANIRDGSVNSVGTIKDIVSMRIYQPRVPFITSGSYNMNSETRRVSIVIQEFQSQSFIGPQGSRFHFMLQPVIPVVTPPTTYPNMIELEVEEYNDGRFDFRRPVVTFDSLTLSFLDPVNIIPFLHDRDNITFTYGNPTIITTSIPHLFVSTSGQTYGVISGFNTANPAGDAATINAINSLIELTLTVTGSNTFTIPIDTSTVTPIGGLVAQIFFNERRVVIPIELTYLRSDK